MKITVLFLLLHSVFAHDEFGSSYLKNSLLCKPWNCINNFLELPDSLPEQNAFLLKLKSIVPEEWQGTAESAVNVCYNLNNTRKYTNTCPGQALLHCVVDNLINQCPESNFRKNDACAPLSSLAGFKYMFSQSRYLNLEKNLPVDRRPSWFLKNYFSTKCCDLPEMFSKETLNKCGFNDMIHLYSHDPKPMHPSYNYLKKAPQQQIQKFNDVNEPLHKEDPLECCDLTDFLPLPSRTKCSFESYWDGTNRLTIRNKQPKLYLIPTHPKPYSGVSKFLSPVQRDLKIVPLSCESETCIFKKLEVIDDDSGLIDEAAFSKILDDVTNKHPDWSSAKARVLTTCLGKKRLGYEEECDINTLLACTFDVLSEHCPRSSPFFVDPCKHTHTSSNGTICQISTSKYRPRNRRTYCELPSLVPAEILKECNEKSVSTQETVVVQNTANVFHNNMYRSFSWLSMPLPCKDTLPSTSCLMNEIGVLNKYNFMDYFKMKEHIREFTLRQPEWAPFKDILLGFYSSTPLYKEHCTSQRKMLNVIDALMMTCPVSKRKNSQMCNELFSDMLKNTSASTEHEEFQPKYYHHHNSIPEERTKNDKGKHIHTKQLPPIARLFNQKKAPKVEIISIKPQIMKQATVKKPRTVLPVYKRPKPELKDKGIHVMLPPLEQNNQHFGPMKPGVYQLGDLPSPVPASSLQTPIEAVQGSYQPNYHDPLWRGFMPVPIFSEGESNRVD